MWRRVSIALGLLALGGAVTLLVSWTAVAFGTCTPNPSLCHWRVNDFKYDLGRANGLGQEVVTVYGNFPFGAYDFTSPYPGRVWWQLTPPPFTSIAWRATGAGWPMFAMQAVECADYSQYAGTSNWQVQHGYRWPRSGDSVLIPTRPLWTGLCVDALVYALVLWTVIMAATMRSRVRRWRGQCVRCGYPRGASSICSECGAAVTPLVTSAPMVEWHVLREKRPEA